MKTADFQRIAREAARDFANSTAWFDCEHAHHKEQAVQALAQVIAKHMKVNFWKMLTVDQPALKIEKPSPKSP